VPATTSSPSVLARAFTVFAAFGPGRADLTLGEIAETSGLPRSTAHRLIRQLEGLGALERTTRGWRVGVRMFEIGQLVPSQLRLRERALPYMGDLHEATRQTIHLAVLEGDDVVYVEVIAGHDKVRSPSRRGGRVPAHCTAVGKVLLAFTRDPPDPDSGPLTARTTATITSVAQLRRELAEVRRAGLAFDDEEAARGLCCVAAPVNDHRGTIAAISISMATGGSLTPRTAAPAVRPAAAALSRDLRGPLLSARPPARGARQDASPHSG
jgi:DNA-binding IclR family transcriptional regulator